MAVCAHNGQRKAGKRTAGSIISEQIRNHASIWQLDSITALPVTLVIVCKYFVQPLRLPLGVLGIRQGWMMTDQELLATTVTPDGSHCDEPCRFYSVLAFSYRYGAHGIPVVSKLASARPGVQRGT